MKRFASLLIVNVFTATSVFASGVCDYVNPFIGTTVRSGNTYPGPQAPFGMISWSPQSSDFGWSPAGYSYGNDKINGFGVIHLSGAGCSASCELPFVPCTGDLDVSPVTHRNCYASTFAHTNEMAKPGYYSVKLTTWNIDFENTVRTRLGIAHIDFPKTAKANLVVNPTADGVGLKDGAIFIDSTNQTISGWARSGGFCGVSGCDYIIYFVARFDTVLLRLTVLGKAINGRRV